MEDHTAYPVRFTSNIVMSSSFNLESINNFMIKSAIDKRDKEMRDELAEFARGKKSRVDFEAPSPVVESVAAG